MSRIDQALSWCTEFEGSTRAIGLLRIALAAIILIRYGNEIAFFAVDDIRHAVLAAYFFLLVPLMLIGAYTRLTVPLVAGLLFCMYFLFGFQPDKVGWNHHHSYLLMISVVFLSFTPCGRSYSLDRYRSVREAEHGRQATKPEYGQLWGTRLIGLQMSALYFWTAVDKSDWAFVSSQRLEQIMVWHHSGRPLATLMLCPAFLVAASIAVVVVEYLLAIAIHLKRLQWTAIRVALAMHATFYILLPVETYSITMIALYLVVLDPDIVHRFLDKLQGHDTASNRI